MPPADLTLAPPFTIAGVDEVGRGPLAGPVVAAAVILDPDRPVDGLDDSKRLGEPERERLDALIRRRALAWCVASASVAEIDALNILHASLLAMRRAVEGLVAEGEDGVGGGLDGRAGGDPGGNASDDAGGGAAGGAEGIAGGGADTGGGSDGDARDRGPASAASPKLADPHGARPAPPGTVPSLVLVDGNRCPVLPYPAAAIVGGDGRVRAIGAASIVAKVARDGLMRRWHAHHPEFGFAAHKGYATRTHRDALARLGATPLHRRSFAPVRDAIDRAGLGRASSDPATPGGVVPPARRPDESPTPDET